MSSKIIIIGAGFAGVWSALAAKRLVNLANKDADIEVLVISPEPSLVIRPRLYEANASSMAYSLTSLFESAGIKFVQGTVKTITTETRTVTIQSASGLESSIGYDRLILAAGSSVIRPRGITGIEEHAFDTDSLQSATELESHIKSLASLPATPARDTVVVCGAGFTGIELATELPKRLAHIPNARIVLVGNADQVGPVLGPGPRPVINQALKDLGVEVKLGTAVAAIDAEGVTLASGERIESKTAVWTAGVRATPLTQQIAGPKDGLCRLEVDRYLRVPSVREVFATGDTASALADTEGHYALMSCQHALQLGRVSGHNAVADLLGEPLIEYTQPAYTCCLDLGSYGAMVSEGWEREVKLTGDSAKRVKRYINQQLIYPPGDAKEALMAANPAGPGSDPVLKQMMQVVG
jgi:NADH dehydrogenase FAD-containing subunit